MIARLALPAILLPLALLPAPPAAADDRIYVAPMLGMIVADSARQLDDPIGGSLALGKPLTDRLNLELSASFLTADGDGNDTSADLTAYGANLLFFPNREQSPVFGLLGVAHGDTSDHPAMGGPADYESTLIDVGLGALWPIFGNRMLLRAQAAYRYDAHFDTRLGDGQRDGFNEPVFGLGLQIPLGRRDHNPSRDRQQPRVVAPVGQAPTGATPNAETTETTDSNAIVLRGVRFDVDSARLTPVAKEILDRIAVSLRRAPDARFELIGHTDSTAGDDYNLALSKRRAEAVRDYLFGLGIAKCRLQTRGAGERKPVASNDTEVGRALNRRVEIELLN